MIHPLVPILTSIADAARARDDWGEVASYIPELAHVRRDQFAICVAQADGRTICAGDADTPFSIQSVSKVFSLALALGRSGDQLWNRVGREPSGKAFNSIIQLENEEGRPRNPFINAGAIVTTDETLSGRDVTAASAEILQFIRTAADDPDIRYNPRVAASEAAHGHRNAALAHYMASWGNLRNPVDQVLETYFRHCAIEMTTRQLALAGRFLIGGPGGLISETHVRRINALMMTCGHYDGSGDFAFRVGLPAKSGVGGGILAIAPGRASIAVWSPGLNLYGNSLQGTQAMAEFANKTGWTVF